MKRMKKEIINGSTHTYKGRCLMKKHVAIILALVMAVAMVIPGPVPSMASSGNTSSDQKAASTASKTDEKSDQDSKTTEKKSDEQASSQGAQPMASYEKMASEDNPIGDNGAYYKVDGISGSPDITAESAVVIDATTGYTLYSKQGDEKRYPASITKVMTALIAIENCAMDEKVSYTEKILNTVEPGSSSAGIGAGAELTMEQSLYALMLVSANEAGAAIACHVAGSDEKFAKLMTKRAKEIGCTKTTFKNPHGLPNEKHVTTGHDMALILKKAMEYKEFRTIASTLSYTIKSDTLPAPIELYNHARILQENSEYYYKNAKGAKTGFTRAALNTLVTWASKDKTELICVILRDYGADRSYIDTRNLFRWGYEQVKTIRPAKDFDLEGWVSENKDKVSKELRQGIRTLKYSFYKKYPILVKKKFDTKNVVCRFEEKIDKEKGELGTLNIYNGDDLMGSMKVTYDTSSVEGRSFNHAGNDDDLSTANVDKGKVSPYFFLLMIGIFLAILLIVFLLIQWRRARKAELRRKQRVLQRRENHISGRRKGPQGEEGPGENLARSSGRKRPFDKPAGKHSR